ncbi:hypothetical protein JCM11491_000724 [Sporobolomyces phaffii]
MASSRLKRKVQLATGSGTVGGDGPQLGNVNESFVSIGTALPALSDPKHDKNEFKPVWEQEVYDDQGRRRLHGAFTGGFSAGYYNTVGSKEGWTPSTFKSSRSNRASVPTRQVAEAAKEFMDEEDLAEMASSRTLETNQTYGVGPSSASSSTRNKAEYDPLLGEFAASASSAAPSFDDTLTSLIEPAPSRVGSDLMRRMGWRPGQGIGPRVSRAQRNRQALEAGVKLDHFAAADEDDDDDEAGKHLFAPVDRPLVLVTGTSASTEKGWGLGYRPGSTLHARVGGSLSGRGGVEEDPYGASSRDDFAGLAARDKKAFRVADEIEPDGDDDDNVYSIARSARGRPGARTNAVGQTAARSPESRPRVFHDGTPVLPGFSLDLERPTHFASTSKLPPPPPPGWKPDPARLWSEPRGEHDPKGKGRQLDADERGTLLGEQAPRAVPKSVFDYLSAKSRDRLESLTQSSPSAGSSTTTTKTTTHDEEQDVELVVPALDRVTAVAALKGFQPYSAASTSPDPVKQARYTLYLQDQASGRASTTSSPFGPRTVGARVQTVAELNRELSEYAQSARVFRPVSGMLGNRFESSKSGSFDAPKIEPGLYQPPASSAKADLAAKYGSADADATTATPAPTLSPAQLAARAGNFGPATTRTTVAFRPAKLVCKRFGVKDPFETADPTDGGVGGAFGEATATGWSTGEAARAPANQPIDDAAMAQMMQSAGFKQFQLASKVVDEDAPEVAKGAFAPASSVATAMPSKASSRSRPTLETVGLGDDEAQGQAILDEEKAPPDIFAAIFADSEDDDDDDDDDDESADAQGREGKQKEKGKDTESRGESHTRDEEEDSAVPEEAGESSRPAPVDSETLDRAPQAHDPPRASAAEPVADPAEPVSLDSIASYKPSFTSRTTTTTTSIGYPLPPPPLTEGTSTTTTTKPSNNKKKTKPTKRKVALSFDVEGDDAAAPVVAPKKPKKRAKTEGQEPHRAAEALESKPSRRPDSSARKKDEEEDEWEEAASNVHPSILAAAATVERTVAAPPLLPGEATGKDKRARMKASDLY